MGYRCRWQQVGKTVELLPVHTTEKERALISECNIVLALGFKTIFDVHRNGEFIGQVRTTFGGQFYRKSKDEDFIFVGSEWDPDVDPPHGLAVMECISNVELSFEKQIRRKIMENPKRVQRRNRWNKRQRVSRKFKRLVRQNLERIKLCMANR